MAGWRKQEKEKVSEVLTVVTITDTALAPTNSSHKSTIVTRADPGGSINNIGTGVTSNRSRLSFNFLSMIERERDLFAFMNTEKVVNPNSPDMFRFGKKKTLKRKKKGNMHQHRLNWVEKQYAAKIIPTKNTMIIAISLYLSILIPRIRAPPMF